MKYVFQLTAAIVIAIIAASCDQTIPKKKVVDAPPGKAFNTMQLQPRQISGNVQLPGVMQAYEFVQLFPKISGFVKNVYADRGTVVKQGQLLILLEAPEIEQQVASAKLKYAHAQAAYLTSRDRYQRLLATSRTPGTVASFDLEAAASTMRGDSSLAQGEYASYKAMETMKDYLRVVAPFDGVVTERNVHPGALAGPGAQNAKPMLVLQQVSKLRLEVQVPEQYAEQVKDGDHITFKTNALPGQEFTGAISRTGQSLSSNYRSEAIEIDVDNKGLKFKPGMYAEVTLPTSGNANAFVVPKAAIVTTTERRYVITLFGDDNAARFVDVAEGNQLKDSVEVFGALQTGTVVVTNPSYTVKDGAVIGNR